VRYGLQGATLGLLVTLGVLVCTMAPETLHRLRGMRLVYFLPIALVVVCAWSCFAGRIWLAARALHHPVRFASALRIALSTEFGVAASPAGMGGTVVRVSLLRAAGIPLGVVTTMVGADVLLDILFFVLVTPIAVWVLVFDPSWSGLARAIWSRAHWFPVLLLAVPLLFVLLAVIRRASWYRDALWLSHKVPGSVRYRLPARVRLARSRVRASFLQVTSSAGYLYRQRRPAVVAMFLLACLQWCCRYGVLPLLLLSLGTHRNPFPLMALQGILFGVAFILVVPGGGGVVEMMAVMMLPLFVPKALIGLVLLMWRFFTYYVHLLVGGSVFLDTIRRLDRLRHPDPPPAHGPFPWIRRERQERT
jgi:uncharacterized protein (TIRG00374 family)